MGIKQFPIEPVIQWLFTVGYLKTGNRTDSYNVKRWNWRKHIAETGANQSFSLIDMRTIGKNIWRVFLLFQ